MAQKDSKKAKKTTPKKVDAPAKKSVNSTVAPKKNTPGPRRLKQPEYKSFRLAKRIKRPATQKLPSSFKLAKTTIRTIADHPRVLGGITFVYAFLYFVFVEGLAAGVSLTDIKESIQESTEGLGKLDTAAEVFATLLSSAGATTSEVASVYQTMLIILVSIVVIYALRQLMAGYKISVKNAYYRGTYSLVPFLLVLAVIGVQLIPFVAGSWAYSTAISASIATTPPEKIAWGVLAFLLTLLSVYMVCSSVFALYISTLPDMTPMRALRSARQLVLHRRAAITRRVLFLPLVLIIAAGVTLIPAIIVSASVAQWVYFAYIVITPIVAHIYMYNLYRSLL